MLVVLAQSAQSVQSSCSGVLWEEEHLGPQILALTGMAGYSTMPATTPLYFIIIFVWRVQLD